LFEAKCCHHLTESDSDEVLEMLADEAEAMSDVDVAKTRPVKRQFHASGNMPFVDQLTYSGLIGRLMIDLDNAYRRCHPIEHTTKVIFSLICCHFGRSGRPNRSQLRSSSSPALV
jgi:hypothetical protein